MVNCIIIFSSICSTGIVFCLGGCNLILYTIYITYVGPQHINQKRFAPCTFYLKSSFVDFAEVASWEFPCQKPLTFLRKCSGRHNSYSPEFSSDSFSVTRKTILFRPLAYEDGSEHYSDKWNMRTYDIYHFWTVKTSQWFPMFSLFLPWQSRRLGYWWCSYKSDTSKDLCKADTHYPAQTHIPLLM